MENTLVRVYLLDNSYKSIAIDNQTRVGTFLRDCCKKFDINDSHAVLFSLFEVTRLGQRIIPLHEKLIPIVSGWEHSAENKNNKLLFKLSLFVSSLYQNVEMSSPGEIRLLYLYAASLFINGYYPTTIEEAVYLGGLRMQLILGDHSKNIHGQMFQKTPQKLLSFIPQSMQSLKKQAEWEKLLFSSHLKNRGKLASEAEKEYFLYMERKVYFGMKLYSVSVKSSTQHNLSGKMIAGVGSEGISLFKEDHLEEKYEHFDLAKITHFGSSGTDLSFDYGGSVTYILETKKGQEVISVIQVFIDLQMKLKKQIKLPKQTSTYPKQASPVESQEVPTDESEEPHIKKLGTTLQDPSIILTEDSLPEKNGISSNPSSVSSPLITELRAQDGSESLRVQVDGQHTPIGYDINIENQLLDFDDPIVYGNILDTRPPERDDGISAADAQMHINKSHISVAECSKILEVRIKLRPDLAELRKRGFFPGSKMVLIANTVRKLEKEMLRRRLDRFLQMQPEFYELVEQSLVMGREVAHGIQSSQVEVYNKLLERPSREEVVSKNILQEYSTLDNDIPRMPERKTPVRVPIDHIVLQREVSSATPETLRNLATIHGITSGPRFFVPEFTIRDLDLDIPPSEAPPSLSPSSDAISSPPVFDDL